MKDFVIQHNEITYSNAYYFTQEFRGKDYYYISLKDGKEIRVKKSDYLAISFTRDGVFESRTLQYSTKFFH